MCRDILVCSFDMEFKKKKSLLCKLRIRIKFIMIKI